MTKHSAQQIPEKSLHTAILNELRNYLHLKKLSYFPNLEGARRDKRQQVAAMLHGMRAGRPDIEIFLSNGRTVFIELKTSRGRLTDKQKQIHQELDDLGHDVRTIYAPDAVSAIKSLHKILCEYGVIL